MTGIVVAGVLWGALVLGLGWAALLTVTLEFHAHRAPEESGAAMMRAVAVGRMGVLVVAGLAAVVLGGWWSRPVFEALALWGLTVVLVGVAADLLPRMVVALGPRAALRLAQLGRRSLAPLRPLAALVEVVERGLEVLLPAAPPAEGDVRPEERDILAGVLSLPSTTLEAVMTPRLDIVAIEASAEWRDVVEAAGRSDHARIPVYRGDLDDVVGILYAKDLVPAVAGISAPPSDWRTLIRSVPFVPESKSIAQQLRDFQRGPAHVAIVVDEFGGTSGLVTLEDILEEVVGDIRGEYDVDEEPEVEREGADRVWVAGTVAVDELEELLGTSVNREDVATVGGLVYSELGRVPRPGEEFRLGEFRVVVEKVVRRRIHRVYFERLSEAAAEPTAREPAP